MTWAGESTGGLSGLYLFTDSSPEILSGQNEEVVAWRSGLPVFVNQSTLTGVVSPAYFNAYLSVDQTPFAGATTIDLDTVRIQSPAGGFSLSSNEVTVESAAGGGDYKVSYDVNADDTSNSRVKGNWWLEVDDGGGFAEVAGTRRGTYHRNSSQGENSASCVIILELTVGDIVRIRGQRTSGGGNIFAIADGVSLTIEKVNL